MEAHSLNGRPLHARLATATCTARARAPFMLQPCVRRHTDQPLSAVDSPSARASAGTCRRQTRPTGRAPRGERKGCPLVSAEHSAAGESKDSSTE